MKKQEVIDLASRRGLCVYEQYEGRKTYILFLQRTQEVQNNDEIRI